MPQLDVYTNNDAEVFVMDAALSRVARSVGSFSDNLSPGLYKIRVSRAGTFQEQLIELGKAQQHYMFIDRFSAIAPIGPMLSDVGRVESLARVALDRLTGPRVLVLAHQSASKADERKPFRGARIFPWRATRNAVRLDEPSPITAITGNELWAAVAVKADPADGPFVLEVAHGAQIARQAVLVARDWQTRIFLRADNADRVTEQTAAAGTTEEATPFDVSIQMAQPTANVVYSDHWETVEVARSALERGRAIFTSERLISELLYEKYDNPIAGLTGLHLFLDAKARSEAGDAAYDLAPGTKGLARDEQGIADEVLVNLTKLLHPERAAAAQKQARSSADLQQTLLFPDPVWPESADLTALRVRAGRCRQQVFVPSPPMFRVSWDVLKANAARDGLTWISRELWSSTGTAGSAGPYLAWARGRHSVKRTLQRISDQFADRPRLGSSLPFVVGNTGALIAGSDTVRDEDEISSLESMAVRPSAPSLESMVAGTVDNAAKIELAASFGLPLSILQKAPDKTG